MAERRLAILGDVHGQLNRMAEALAALDPPFDALLLTGDLSLDPARRHVASVAEVLALAAERAGSPVAYVPGNHDLPDVSARAAAEGVPIDLRCCDVDRRRVELGGFAIGGIGGAGPARFGFPYEWSEAEVAPRVAAFRGAPLDVWLIHTPPADTSLDATISGEHVGSVEIRRSLARLGPKLAVCGHIHEAWGVERVDGVPTINAGALGPPFEQAIGWLVGWDDGPRWIESRRLVGDRLRIERHEV